MTKNIYDYIQDNFGISVKDYRFKRDYILNPLQKTVIKRGNKSYEFPDKDDFCYIYLKLNVHRESLCQIFNVSNLIITKILKTYGIHKDKKLSLELRNKSNLMKYGIEYPQKLNSVKEKQKQTNLKKYGFKSTTQHPIVKGKQEASNIEKYGVKNVFENKDIQEKCKKSMKEKYGHEYALQNDELLNRSKTTKMNKYGNPFFVNSKKRKETNLTRYGYQCLFQDKNFKEKCLDTMISKYGAKTTLESPILKRKVLETNMKKYKSTSYLSSTKAKEHRQEYIKKATKTLAKEYKNHPYQSKEELEILTKLKVKFPDIQTQWIDDNYPGVADFFIPSKNIVIEYQGSWVHGPSSVIINGETYSAHEPFNPNNNIHQIILEYYEQKNTLYYTRAIKCWTKKDVSKRLWAENHPKYYWLEFFTKECILEWIRNN